MSLLQERGVVDHIVNPDGLDEVGLARRRAAVAIATGVITITCGISAILGDGDSENCGGQDIKCDPGYKCDKGECVPLQ